MKAAVVIPVFNHAGSVGRVIEEVRAVLAEAAPGTPIIAVDDGSTDGSGQVLGGIAGITVLTHAQNRGKGAALRTGFVRARKLGCTHAVSVDADGQHRAADVAVVWAAARRHPDDLILGRRDLDAPGAGVPPASKKGRDASRFWLRVETGRDIPDSQCGLRAYPLAHALAVPQRFQRYDFETEILARLAWGGVAIRDVPVACIYFPGPRRISHFRPVMDTLRGAWAHVFLVFRRIAPLPFTRLVSRGDSEALQPNWWRWATWRAAIIESLRAGASNAELAMAFAVGVFVGLTPLYGVQALLVVYLCRRGHLNVVAGLLGSQISMPPLSAVWLGLSYAVGNFLWYGQWIITDARAWSVQSLAAFLLGNLLLAAAGAALGLFAARGVLHAVRGQRMAR